MAGRGGSAVTARGGATNGGFERNTAGTVDDRGIECFLEAIFGGAGRLRMLPAREGRAGGPFFFFGGTTAGHCLGEGWEISRPGSGVAIP
jgi:hypothetical protein